MLDRLTSETSRLSEDKIKALHSEHAAHGLLKSGGTIRKAARVIENEASSFVEQAVDGISAVAQDVDAFNLISSSLTAAFRDYQDQFSKTTRMAAGVRAKGNTSAHDAADRLFSELRKRIFQQLEIHRFSFTRPSAGDMAASRQRLLGENASSSKSHTQKNIGGKPLAKHWDAMWADIAVQLWNGDLKPETQADLKSAMFAWFNDHGIDIGDTAVTQRARQLWQAMQEAGG